MSARCARRTPGCTAPGEGSAADRGGDPPHPMRLSAASVVWAPLSGRRFHALGAGIQVSAPTYFGAEIAGPAPCGVAPPAAAAPRAEASRSALPCSCAAAPGQLRVALWAPLSCAGRQHMSAPRSQDRRRVGVAPPAAAPPRAEAFRSALPCSCAATPGQRRGARSAPRRSLGAAFMHWAPTHVGVEIAGPAPSWHPRCREPR